MFINKLKTILLSDFDFFYLFIFIILILACRFNYFWFVILVFLVKKLKRYKYLKLTILVSVFFIFTTTSKFFLPIFENNLYYTISQNDNYTLLNKTVIYDKLDKNAIYYIEGKKQAIKAPSVIGAFNYKNYYLSKNILYSLEVSKIKKLYEFKLLNITDKLFEDKAVLEKSYLKTILLANNSIDSQVMEVYKALGISHLFSVSGLHITIFAFILNKLFKKFMKKSYQKATCFFLVFYIFLSGFRVSVVRASLFFIFDYLFSKWQIRISRLNILSLSGIVVLFFYPFAFLDYGFILSYLVSFIFIIGFRFMKSQNVAIFCYLATLPVVINMNFSFSLISPFLNIVYPLFFSSYLIVMAIISALGLDFFKLFYSSILLLENISVILNDYNVVIKVGKIHILYWFLYYYFLYKLFVKIETKNTGIFSFVFQAFTIIILAYNIKIPKVVIIDVNQGSSYYLQQAKTLIDTGGLYYTDITKKQVLPILDFYATKNINLILTHCHYDHYGGYLDIVDNYKSTIYIGEYNKKLLNLVYKYNYKTLSLYDNLDNKNIQVWGPNKYYDNENNNSLILRYNFYGDIILFPGDSELKNYPKADILVMPHHGSKNAFDDACYNQIKPKKAIISSGEYKIKHLPSKEVINLLKFYNVDIYNTSASGSIYIVHCFNNYILDNYEFNLLYGNIL